MNLLASLACLFMATTFVYVQAQDTCIGKDDGKLYAVSNDNTCMRFFMCSHGSLHEFTCPASTRFDTAIKGCVLSGDVECPRSSNLEPAAEANLGCSFVGNGESFRLGSDCRKYYTCDNGEARGFTCAAGMSFGSAAQPCVREPVSGSQCSVATHPACAGRQNGWYNDPDDCSKGYQCVNGALNAIRTDCSQGQTFNTFSQTCVSDNAATCTERLCANRAENSMQRYDEYDCSSYYRCVGGRVIAEQCDTATPYFSNLAGRCVTMCDRNNDCRRSMRVNEAVSCRNYRQCQNDIQTSGTCLDGEVWSLNASQCVQAGSALDDCIGSVDSPFTCNEGERYRDARFCGVFYECPYNTTVRKVCPGGLVYSLAFKTCVSSSDVARADCLLGDDRGTNDAVARCADSLSDGRYFRDNSKCQFYYVCKAGRALQRRCVGDTVLSNREGNFNDAQCVERASANDAC